MKKLILFSFVLLFIFPAKSVFAQVNIPVYMVCDETKDIVLRGTCYNVSTHATEDDAVTGLLNTLKGNYNCNPDSCDFPSSSTCTLAFGTTPTPKLNQNGTKWCFRGNISIKCTECTEKDEIPEEEEPEEIPEDDGGNIQGDDSHDHGHSDQRNLKEPKIKSINPNPSSGVFNVVLDLDKDNAEEIQLFVSNLGGKKISNKVFRNISSNVFNTSINLSNLEKGIYFVTALVDNNNIGSSKIVIQ